MSSCRGFDDQNLLLSIPVEEKVTSNKKANIEDKKEPQKRSKYIKRNVSMFSAHALFLPPVQLDLE